MSYRWLTDKAIRALYKAVIHEFGGATGDIDDNLLGATLARPQQLANYDEEADLAAIAAAYGFGFCRNHPFVDGNKRIALVAMDVFLQLNQHQLIAGEVETVGVIQQLAAGKLTENALAEWVRENMAPWHGTP